MPDNRRMTLRRHAMSYAAIGLVQWLVEYGLMVVLSRWVMPVEPANVIGRVAGAVQHMVEAHPRLAAQIDAVPGDDRHAQLAVEALGLGAVARRARMIGAQALMRLADRRRAKKNKLQEEAHV